MNKGWAVIYDLRRWVRNVLTRGSVGRTPEPSTAAEHPDDLTLKLAAAELAYREVLDATKHQDDKIGRFLTALAFLTTGSIALLFKSDLLAVRFAFDANQHHPHGFPLIGWVTAGFFLCVVGSVALLLLCLSSPLRIPGKRLVWGPTLDNSRIFFSYIGEERAFRWERRWLRTDPQTIREELLVNLVRETHNLSERARAKYQHTNEAAALFVLSLLFLGIAVVLSIKAGMDGTTSESSPVVYGHWTALALGLTASGHVALQLYTRVVHDQQSFQLAFDAARRGHGSDAAQMWRAARSLRSLLITVPIYVLALALPGSAPDERRAGWCVAIVAIVMTFWLTHPRWESALPRQKVKRIAVLGVAPTAIAGLTLWGGGVWQLGGILLPPVWFSLAAVSASYRRHSAGLRKAESAGRALRERKLRANPQV